MAIRKPVLNKPTIKALLALTKVRCTRSDHELRPPISPNALYRLNTTLVSTEKLKPILPTGIRYVIVGGVASAYYQPARFTEKTDIMVLAEDSTAIEQALEAAGWN